MSEWYDNRQKPNSNFRKLLQERLEKANPRRTLTAEEQKRLSKLERIVDTLWRDENVQNRQLQSCLGENEYTQIEVEWETQKNFREKLKNKPSELKRYEDKLKEAIMMRNRSDAYHRKGKKSAAYKLDSKCESLFEDAPHVTFWTPENMTLFFENNRFDKVRVDSIGPSQEDYHKDKTLKVKIGDTINATRNGWNLCAIAFKTNLSA